LLFLTPLSTLHHLLNNLALPFATLGCFSQLYKLELIPCLMDPGINLE
jgi:hypothetical protein